MFSIKDFFSKCDQNGGFGHIYTAQKMKFSITDFFCKCDQINKSLMENFIFCAVLPKESWMENFIFCAVLPQGIIHLVRTKIRKIFFTPIGTHTHAYHGARSF